ncbi:hypothetical protein [Amycolatopsis orientalis]|uniref:hypothetical protein n=1 Tax=Amycolatopsis orientalis TaxID=31958 RepID=UPI00039F5C17|nr:hypothetical protein [Amycolatopsis orientalis]
MSDYKLTYKGLEVPGRYWRMLPGLADWQAGADAREAADEPVPEFDYFTNGVAVWRFRPGARLGERIGFSSGSGWRRAAADREACESPFTGVRRIEYGQLPKHAK